MLNNIEAERARHNLSRTEIAKKLNITPNTYRRWINEEANIPSSALIKMSKMFKVSIDYLLDIAR